MATKYDIKDYLRDVKAANGRLITRTNEELQAMIDCLDELEKPRDTTCNGWTNWETWTVRMALDDMEETMRDMAARESGKYRLGEQIQDYIQNTIDELETETRSDRGSNRYFTDAAITSFMQEVNWTELAEYVIADAEEADEYEHSGAYHITKEPSGASGLDDALALEFQGTWKECLNHIEELADADDSADPDDTVQEARDDGTVIIGDYYYSIEPGKADPADFEADSDNEDDYEPPVRDMDDAGN